MAFFPDEPVQNPWAKKVAESLMKDMEKPSYELLYWIANDVILQMLKDGSKTAEVVKNKLIEIYDHALRMPNKDGGTSLEILKEYPTAYHFVRRSFDYAENWQKSIMLVGENYQLTDRGRKTLENRERRTRFPGSNLT